MKFEDILQVQAEKAGIVLQYEQLQKFAVYYEMLVQTNEQINLTAITQPESVAVKHMIDSLTVYDEHYFSAAASICDVGTGAGFPGLPLKLYKPDLRVILLDSLAKRLNFLNTVIASLQLTKIETCHIRAEDAGHNKKHREQYDVVLARAVAPLNVLSEYCLPLVKVGGVFAAMKAKQAESELLQAKNAIKMLGARIEQVKEVKLPGLDDTRIIIYLRKQKHTLAQYPRKAGLPAKNPLL